MKIWLVIYLSSCIILLLGSFWGFVYPGKANVGFGILDDDFETKALKVLLGLFLVTGICFFILAIRRTVQL